MSDLELIDWGRTRYAEAFEKQKARVESRKAGDCGDALIFTEHEPVFTMGLRKGAKEHLIWKEATLAARGIEVFQSNRGGDMTYHGPGQIVGYPIISLAQSKDLHLYLRAIEEVVIRTLAGFGLASARREGKTGIWLETRKICAIGVAVKSWVTYHGFALNVDPDLSHFEGIVPCGITDGTVTSLVHELGRSVDLDEVKTALAVEYKEVFANTAPHHE
ncbi:MAG: lipoyl(octanoyl) transferase LipB [Opitutales bacterium]